MPNYLKLKRYDEAIAPLKEAIRLNPDDAYAHNNLGITYAELKRYDEALVSYKEVIRINPDDAEAHNGLGASFPIVWCSIAMSSRLMELICTPFHLGRI